MYRRYRLYIGLVIIVLVAVIYGGQTRSPSASLGQTPAETLAVLWARPLSDLKGEVHTLADWKGRPMVVNFWATWCAPCVKEMPELERLQQTHPQVNFIGIALDSADNLRAFVQKVPVSYPLLMMGSGATDILRTLGNPTGGLPFTLVFNAEGRIEKSFLGQVNTLHLKAVLARLGA